jgi:hypothetical protein
MFESFKRNLTPSMAVGLLALFVAIGGAGAIAASKIKLGKNAVKTKNIKNKAVTGPKIADGAVGSAQLAAGALPSTATVHSDKDGNLIAAGSSAGVGVKPGTVGGSFCIKLPFAATTGQVTLDGANGANGAGPATLFVPNNNAQCPDPAYQAAQVTTFSTGQTLFAQGFFATFSK